MQEEKKNKNMDSQADTYIEACFERKCYEAVFSGYHEILNQWRNDKSLYTSYTAISGFDFQHYSMHDKSHSEAILRYIEMVLGRDRVDALNVSDLWLLLESAYCHDIGMALTYEELCSVWESDDFKEYVKASLYCDSGDRRKAAAFYEKMDKLIKNKSEIQKYADAEDYDEYEKEFNEMLEHDSWPVIWERYILLLYTEYIRKKHPERSQAYIIAAFCENDELRTAGRMYHSVADVVMLHGEDFDKIFTAVNPTENGFDSELMHPQFAAAMLRLGDLLDMDSNRFNIRMIKHMGIIPLESIMHMKKHKAITHLSYSKDVIQAEASSNDFDVCKTTNQWFQWLDQEVKNLICYWNKIVPETLYGCRLNRCECRIFYKKAIFDANKQTKFQADSERIYDLFIGENIYKSRFDFIREYLQNALDATKMKLWLKLKDQEELWEKYEIDRITPFDIGKNYYEELLIEVRADVDWKKNLLILSIQDRGIGMEDECVKALSNVEADSWGKRSAFATEMLVMPAWLRPTGGFGIGVQSAFMIADGVEFITKSETEAVGKIIRLDNRRNGGKVSKFEEKNVKNGTKVCVKIGITEFVREIMKNTERLKIKDLTGDLFDRHKTFHILQNIIMNYVSEEVEYSLFPVRICCNTEKAQRTGMAWYPSEAGEKSMKLKKMDRRIFFGDKESDMKYAVCGNQLFLWDYANSVMVVYTLRSNSDYESFDQCYYKGILIGDEKIPTDEPFFMRVIYHSENVRSFLSVNRDHLKMEQRTVFEEDVCRYRRIFAALFIQEYNDFHEDTVYWKRMVLQALILEKLGIIKVPANKKGKITQSFSDDIKIKRINFENLSEIDHMVDPLNGENHPGFIKKRETADFIREQTVFKSETLVIKKLLDDLKTRKYVFFMIENAEEQIEMEWFSKFIETLKRKMKEKEQSKKSSENDLLLEEFCWKLVQDDAYLVTDERICNTFLRYGNDFELLNIKTRYGKCYRIIEMGHTEKSRKKIRTVDKNRIKELVCCHLGKILETTENFPVILCTENVLAKEMLYPLWVNKVLTNGNLVDLDQGNKQYNDIPMEGDRNFLILPLTQKLWETAKEPQMTEDKFLDLATEGDGMNFLIEWIYAFQINDSRLSRTKIASECKKLLVDIYKWINNKKPQKEE